LLAALAAHLLLFVVVPGLDPGTHGAGGEARVAGQFSNLNPDPATMGAAHLFLHFVMPGLDPGIHG
jgi:hypothetical protein